MHVVVDNFFRPYVARLADPSAWRLEQVADRMMIRKAGQVVSAESWHRDEAALAEPSDHIFGGWANLDDHDQVFSCVLGTHTGVAGHSGFATIKDKEMKAQYKATSTTVRIPPGCIIVFFERIVHEVVGRKAVHDMYRLFLGWRITQAASSLFGDISTLERLADQAVMPLKSSQNPPMYANLHWVNHRGKIEDFSQHVVQVAKHNRTVRSGQRAGDVHCVVHEHMRSLVEYNMPLYAPYTAAETAIFLPNTQWDLRRPGTDIVDTVRLHTGNNDDPIDVDAD